MLWRDIEALLFGDESGHRIVFRVPKRKYRLALEWIAERYGAVMLQGGRHARWLLNRLGKGIFNGGRSVL
jgi:hypothetical protein